MKTFHESDRLLFESTFQQSSARFSCMTSRSMQVDLVTSMYFSGMFQCFFLRHIELNSRFIVMTIDEVPLNRPKVGTGFSGICWFCRLRLSRFTLKFSTLNLRSSQVVPASEWILGNRSFFLTIFLYHLRSGKRIHHLSG